MRFSMIICLCLSANLIWTCFSCRSEYQNTQIPPVPSEGFIADTKGLYLRSEPSTQSTQILLMPYRTKIVISGPLVKGDLTDELRFSWWPITYKGKSGFAASNFISTDLDYLEKSYSGRYIMTHPKGPTPTFMLLKYDMSFTHSVNVCHGFIEVYGTWKYQSKGNLENRYLILTVRSSNSWVKATDQLVLYYNAYGDELIREKITGSDQIDLNFKDCDFYPEARFKKTIENADGV